VLKYQYIFQTKYTEAFLNSTRKQLWFDITKMLIAVYYAKKTIVSFIIIFGTLSFPKPPKSEFVLTMAQLELSGDRRHRRLMAATEPIYMSTQQFVRFPLTYLSEF